MLPLGLLDAPSPASVLVVDDNAGKRLAVRAMLAPLGHAIVEVDSGTRRPAAPSSTRASRSSSWTSACRSSTATRRPSSSVSASSRRATPIIFLTAYGRDETETASAYASGAVDFIFTPVLADVLRAKVSAFIHLFVQSRELQRSLESITALNGALRDRRGAHARGAAERGGRDRDRRRSGADRVVQPIRATALRLQGARGDRAAAQAHHRAQRERRLLRSGDDRSRGTAPGRLVLPDGDQHQPRQRRRAHADHRLHPRHLRPQRAGRARARARARTAPRRRSATGSPSRRRRSAASSPAATGRSSASTRRCAR